MCAGYTLFECNNRTHPAQSHDLLLATTTITAPAVAVAVVAVAAVAIAVVAVTTVTTVATVAVVA